MEKIKNLCLIPNRAWIYMESGFNSSLTTSLKFGFGMLILSGMANEQLENLSHKPFISGHFHIGRLMRAAMAGINLWQPPWMIGSLQTEGHVIGQYII